VSAAGARAHEIGRLRAARLARRARVRGGFTYEEALAEGLLDPGRSDAVLAAYVGRHRRRAIQTRLNPPPLQYLAHDKLAFSRHGAALGLPVPALYGTLGRREGWSALSGRIVRGPEAFAALLREELPAGVVVKPTDGRHGVGVRVIDRSPDGALLDVHGRPLDPRRLHADIVADPEFDLFLIEQRLHDHPDVQALVEGPTLQTLRLMTMVRRDGTPCLLGGMMKLGLGGGDADNYHDGLTGNGLCDIDLERGVLGPLMLPRADGAGFRTTSVVPGTGRRVVGWEVPMLREACDLVLRAAPLFMPLRSLGWDVAITPDGPVLVEANTYWAMSFTPLSPESRALFLEG
jgi:hypothetical protein